MISRVATLLIVLPFLIAGCARKEADDDYASDPPSVANVNPKQESPVVRDTKPAKGKKTAKPPVDPAEEELKKNAQDLHEYTANLKKTIPYDMKRFADAGFKAESYEKDPLRDWFMVVVVRVEPVYLHDKITGQTKKYTRAKLVRNNPKPPTINPRTGSLTSIPETFTWVTVDMLP